MRDQNGSSLSASGKLTEFMAMDPFDLGSLEKVASTEQSVVRVPVV